MRSLRVVVYVIAASAIIGIAFSNSFTSIERSGATGKPESWRTFLTAYLYASLALQSKEHPPGSKPCDYPPTVAGKRPETGDHATMIGYTRCLQGLGELTEEDIATLERDPMFAVQNGDWLPFRYAGVTGVARNGTAIAVSTGGDEFDRGRFALLALAGLGIVALIGLLDARLRRRRAGRAW